MEEFSAFVLISNLSSEPDIHGGKWKEKPMAEFYEVQKDIDSKNLELGQNNRH